jgi:hypothetical protein
MKMGYSLSWLGLFAAAICLLLVPGGGRPVAGIVVYDHSCILLSLLALVIGVILLLRARDYMVMTCSSIAVGSAVAFLIRIGLAEIEGIGQGWHP